VQSAPVDLDSPEDTIMQNSSSDLPMQLQQIYELGADLEIERLAAELIVLPDQEPVKVVAWVSRAAALPAPWRELDLRLQCSATAGQVVELSQGGPTRRLAFFYPPRESACVTLNVGLEVDLDNGRGETATLRRDLSFRLLTPCSSLEMVAGQIDGYEIGVYPDPLDPAVFRQFDVKTRWFDKYPDRYRAPAFFYRVDPSIKHLKIAPTQTLDFWITDYPWKSLGAVQYIALDLNLVRKLEELVDLMRAAGFTIARLVSIYGFRPPAFNLGTIEEHPEINLKEPFSMHQYGRASDFIIDEDGDGMIDDLNGDGVIDIHDAAVIMHYVNILDRRYRQQGRMEMVGGAGLYTHNDFGERSAYYGQTPDQSTPYIHVDTRGFLADNGSLVRWPDRWPDGSPIRFGQIGPDGFATPAPATQAPAAQIPTPLKDTVR
jgi:hypothetical protein